MTQENRNEEVLVIKDLDQLQKESRIHSGLVDMSYDLRTDNGAQESSGAYFIIRDADELGIEDKLPQGPKPVTVTEDDLYVEMSISSNDEGDLRLVALLGDGSVKDDTVKYVLQYVDQMEEENIDVPGCIRTAILSLAPAMYAHYGREKGQELVGRLADPRMQEALMEKVKELMCENVVSFPDKREEGYTPAYASMQ